MLPNLRTLYNDCTEVAGVEGEPDGIFTTQSVAETLESLVVPAIRYTGGGTSELSSRPTFRGASINWESKVDSGYMYVLNSKHIFGFVHRDADFAMADGGLQNPVNQDAFIAPILYQGNLGTNLRSAHGVLQGIT